MAVWVREYDGGNKDGKKAWWVFVKHEGKTTKKRVGTGVAGHKAAVLMAERMAARIILEQFDGQDEPRLTFAAFAGTWLDTVVDNSLRPGTAEKYREVMRVHWIPVLGGSALSGISRQDVRAQIILFQKSGYQHNTIRYWINVLQSCFTAAIQDNKIHDNPASQASKGLIRKLTSQIHTIDTFTAAELMLLMRRAGAKSPMTHAILITMARTGMRISEVLGLQVGDLDFESRKIYLRRTWGNRSRGPDYHGPPKSGKMRLIDMSQQLVEALQAYIAVTEPRNWLFPARHGRPMTPNSYYSVHWKPLFAGVGGGVVHYRHPHVLRHTYATDMLSIGKSDVYVKEQLGHASIKITVDLYGQWIRNWSNHEVDDLDQKQTAGLRKVPSWFRTEKNGLTLYPGGGQ